MSEFEPKETGLQRTVWLFEREILEKLENTDLEDHHTVLKFNLFSMKYEIKPKFDNGRADAIVMRNTANHWFKIWFKAFSACSCDQQSKIEQLEKEKALQELEINQVSQANQEWQRLNFEKEKRISDALKVLSDVSPTMLDKKEIRILRGECSE